MKNSAKKYLALMLTLIMMINMMPLQVNADPEENPSGSNQFGLRSPASDDLVVSLGFYDYDGTNPVNVPALEEGEKYYLIALATSNWSADSVTGLPDETLWAIQELTGFQGAASPFTASITTFNTRENNSETTKTFSELSDEQKNPLKIRLVHTASMPTTFSALKQMAQNSNNSTAYNDLINGGIDGFDPMSGNSTSMSTDSPHWTTNFKKGNTKEQDIKLHFVNPEGADTPADTSIEGEKNYVLLDATSQDGNSHYYNVVEIEAAAGAQDIYLPVPATWSSSQKYSENWQSVNVKVIKAKDGALATGGNQPSQDSYTDTLAIDGYTYTLGNEWASETDDTNHKDRKVYTITLTKPNLQNATTPKSILGEAVEFGLVANRYEQYGHSESNFAVNHFKNEGDNIDIDGSGDAAIPFYMASIDDGSQFWISSQTIVPVDLFVTQYEIDHNQLKITMDTDAHHLEQIVMSEEAINTYVNGLISHGRNKSTELSGRTTITPTITTNNKVIDVTDFPDNKTIYINCSNADIGGIQGWEIHKLPGQSLVFNIPGEGTESSPITVSEFYVNVHNADGSVERVQSTTSAMNGDTVQNEKVDRVIFEHITFNAYQAKYFHLDNASGLFLAPEATKVTQSNGAGWILTGGTIESHAEWHFYRHHREYRSVSEKASLELQKKLEDKYGHEVPYVDRGYQFTISQADVTVSGANQTWTVKTTQGEGWPKTSTPANADGIIKIPDFSYTDTDLVKEGDTYQTTYFHYLITENHPSDSLPINQETLNGIYFKDGLLYSASDIRIKVKAEDDGSHKIKVTIYVVGEDGTETEITEQNKRFLIGDAINTAAVGEGTINGEKKLKIKKGDTETDGVLSSDDINAFTFRLTAVTPEAPMPDATTVPLTKEKDAEKYTFAFDSIHFDLADLDVNENGIPQPTTFEYLIEELGDRIDQGIVNDNHRHTVKLTVSVSSTDPTVLDVVPTYYVDNLPVTGTDVSALFTNTKELTDKEVEKKWKKPDGSDVTGEHTNDSVTVKLVAVKGIYTPPSDTTADLKVSANWNDGINPADVEVVVTATNSDQPLDTHTVVLKYGNWTQTIPDLTVGATYKVTASKRGSGDATLTAPTTETVLIGGTGNQVAFSGTYIEHANLEVGIDWNYALSGAEVCITATNTQDTSDIHSVTFSGEGKNWRRLLTNLTVGNTYNVTIATTQSSNSEASITEPLTKSITISRDAAHNSAIFAGTYTHNGQGRVAVNINWQATPADGTQVRVTASSLSDTRSITLDAASEWKGIIEGLHETEHYKFTPEISSQSGQVIFNPTEQHNYYLPAADENNLSDTITFVATPSCGKATINVATSGIYAEGGTHASKWQIIGVGFNNAWYQDIALPYVIDENLKPQYQYEYKVQFGGVIDSSRDVTITALNATIDSQSVQQYGGYGGLITFTLTTTDTAPTITVNFARTDNSSALQPLRYTAAARTLSDITYTKPTSSDLTTWTNLTTADQVLPSGLTLNDYFVVDTVTLQKSSTEDENWKCKWTDLPTIYRDPKDGKIYTLTYYVVETSAEDVASNTYTTDPKTGATIITNTENRGTITVGKEVQLNGTTNTGAANETFYVGLFTKQGDAFTRVSGTTNQVITINNEGTGAASFADIKYGTYYVFEMKGNSDERITNHYGVYSVTGSGTEVTLNAPTVNAGTIINNHETIDISGTKTWSDNKTDHDTMNAALLTLKRKIESDTEYSTVTGVAPAWTQDSENTKLYTYSYSNLEKYDANGNEYTYLVEETVPADYVMTSTANGIYGKNFVNKWATGSYAIRGAKGMNVGTLTNEELSVFTFTLSAVSPANAPMPNETERVKNLTNVTDPTFAFGAISFKLTDLNKENGEPVATTFTYKVTETGSVDGIENDPYEHTVELTVSVDPEDPTKLVVTPVYKSNNYVILEGLAEFTNTRLYGDLELSKTVTGTDDKSKEFTFEIELKDKNGAAIRKTFNATLTDKDGTVDNTKSVAFDDNGKATAILKADEKLLIENIPSGATYTITEKVKPDGYSQVTPEGAASGTIAAGDTQHINFVNTYQATGKVSFKAKKVFNGGNLADKSFTIKLSQVTGENSTTLVTGSTAKLSGTITRTINNETTDATAVFEDIVTFCKNKNQDDTKDENGTKTYWFLLEEDIPDNKNHIEYDTNKKWIGVTLADNGQGVLTVTKSPAATNDLDITFTNQQLGDVKVTKVFAGDEEAIPTNFKVTASYRLNGDTEDTIKEFTLDNVDGGSGKAGDPYHWTIRDLPINTQVTFTESGIIVNGYTLSVKNGAGEPVTVTGTGTDAKAVLTAIAEKIIGTASTAAFVNTYERDKGKLRVTKNVTVNGSPDNVGDLLDGEYTLNVTGIGDDPRTKGTSHVVKITITHGAVVSGKIDGTAVNPVTGTDEKEWIELANLPTGQYRVEEITTGLENEGITLSSPANNEYTLTVVKDGPNVDIPTATFTNNRGAGALVIRKTVRLTGVTGDAVTAHNNTEFNFRITLTEQDGTTPVSGIFTKETGTYNPDATDTKITYNTTTESIRFDDGIATITLKHNEVVRISGIPLKTKYTVQETGNTNTQDTYAVSPAGGQSSGTIRSEDTEEEFINSYSLTGTSITFGGTKTIEGTNSTEQMFTFQLYEADQNYSINESTLIETVTKGEITSQAGKPFSFSPIDYETYAAEGPHYYVIKEKTFASSDEAKGWSISTQQTQEYHIKVEVTKVKLSDGNYKLKAEITEGPAADQMNFTNTYEATGKVSFSAKKVFTSGTITDGMFTFNLKQVVAENNETEEDKDHRLFEMRSGSPTRTNATVDFDELTFFKGMKNGNYVNQEGEYWFMIEEQLPDGVSKTNPIKDGIKYDTTKHWIKVTVKDDKQGGLTVTKNTTPASGEPDATFTNDQLGSVRVSKAFKGHAMPAGFQIEATITPPSSSGTAYTKILKTTSEGGALTPDTGEGTEEKPYIWTIKDLPIGTTVIFTESGITVDGYTLEVTGATLATGNGTTTATTEAKTAAINPPIAEIVNTYTRDIGSLTLIKQVKVNTSNATTSITNTSLIDGTYTFSLVGSGLADGQSREVTVTIRNGAVSAVTGDHAMKQDDGSVLISELPTGTYAVTEDTTGLSAKAIRLIEEPTGTLTVLKDGTGTIPTVTFVNAGMVGELEIKKKVTANAPLTPPSDAVFTFKVTLKDDTTPISGTFAAKDMSNGTAVTSVTFDTNGEAIITLKADESIVIRDIPQKAAYTIEETDIPDGFRLMDQAGVKAGTIGESRSVVTFTNKYTLKGTSVVFGGHKSVLGTDSTDKAFSFKLVETDKNWNPLTNPKLELIAQTSGTITKTTPVSYSFAAIEYETPGTHYYVITEIAGETGKGWTYAANQYKEKVEVKDNGSGGLFTVISGTTASNNDLDFTNKYKATGKLEFKARKILEKGTLADGEFTFRITQVTGQGQTDQEKENKVLARPETVAVPANGIAEFPTITFTKDDTANQCGNYWFLLEEVAEGLKDGKKDGVLYDTNRQRWIQVTVSDLGDGTLNVVKAPAAQKINGIDIDATFINKQLGDVRITKAFIGQDVPKDFRITATYNDGSEHRIVFTKDNKISGTGIEAEPYIWEIKDLLIGTEVTFVESGIQVDGYTLTVTGNATIAADGKTAAAVATVVNSSDPATAEFINSYVRDLGSLKIRKTVTVDGKTTTGNLADGTYTFTIQSLDGVTPATTKTVKIVIENGAAVSATIDGTSATITNGTVTISGLPTGDYTVSEDTTGLADRGIVLKQNPTGAITVPKDGTADIPTVSFVNNKFTISVQKTDIMTGEELSGAHIQILDKNNKVVDEWDSEAGKPHEVTSLIFGETYTLRETVAPIGYSITTDTHFTIMEDGKVTSSDTTIRDADGVLLVEDTAESTCATIRKVWDDDDNRDGLRPASLTVALLANGTASGRSVTLNAANHWTARLDSLPLFRNGEKVTYTWQEPTVVGYTLKSSKAENGILTTLTNTHTPEKTAVSVKKVWADNNNAGNTRPASIQVQLFADGIAAGDPVTLSADNKWVYSWTDLDLNIHENGVSRTIRYTVAETEIQDGYVCTVTGNATTGFVITNSISTGKLIIEKTFDIDIPEPEEEVEEETTDFEVEKVWLDDNDNADGNRPESITVRLYAGGQEIKVVKLNASNGWRHHFGNLPKFVNGKPIHYSVREDPVEGYVTEIDGFTIYNKYQPEMTQVTVRKIWNDENNKDQKRPESIWMKLNNGMTVMLNEGNGWTATIAGLPAKVNGKPAEYTWTEQSIIGYELESMVTEDNITIITNRLWMRPDAPSQGRMPKTAGDTVYTFEEYDTPLGVEIVINHVGDCFD